MVMMIMMMIMTLIMVAMMMMIVTQVAVYGFNERIGRLSFPPKDQELNKPYSPETATMIDEEVRKLVDIQYERCRQIITEKKDLVIKLAEALLEKEVVNADDLVEILGPRPFQSEEIRNIDVFKGGFGTKGAEDQSTSSTASDKADAETPATDPPEDGKGKVVAF